MAVYRAFLFRDDRIVAFERFDVASDGEALRCAKSFAPYYKVELWDLGRRVGCFAGIADDSAVFLEETAPLGEPHAVAGADATMPHR